MGDMGDFFNDWAKTKQEKRASNRDASPKLLADAGIKFSVRNGDAHLIVEAPTGLIDFWPGTGKWIVRGAKRNGRGVRGLIKFIRGAA